MKTIFDLCKPRADVLSGSVKDEEFAADLTGVALQKSTTQKEYADPDLFFRHTYPTQGLKSLLEAICRRLSGKGGELNSVIRLDTQYGGGKTHSLIALLHSVCNGRKVANIGEFVDPNLLPDGEVRVAALDGENSDPANGLKLEGKLKAYTIWGELAYQLAGKQGYESVRKSDEKFVAPGADTLADLFGGRPTLILIDEVSTYLRKSARAHPDSANQFTAFLHALIKAVSSTPKAALVLTLAVGRDQDASDAYKAEHQIAVQAFEEAESIVSRKLLQLNPTEENETVEVLRRRLFESVDLNGAERIVGEYLSMWDRNKDLLPPDAFSPETRDQLLKGYPFHPELMNVLMEKTSSLSTFQRTRGMLRLLARAVEHLWSAKPQDAHAIHVHHINPELPKIRNEITTRLGQGNYIPAIAADVAAVTGKDPSTAQRIDQELYPGQAPVTSYVARTVLMNTLAYGSEAQGVTPDHLRYSVSSPMLEPSFVEAARKAFIRDSLYLDDRPGAPMRLQVEPNLTQIVTRSMKDVDPDDLRNVLNAKIKELFASRGGDFDPVAFASGPYEVPDDIGNGRPYLVVLNYDAFDVSEDPSDLPGELVRMATRKGSNEEFRSYRNNVVFIVADKKLRSNMQQAVRRRLALEAIKNTAIKDLADYQQRKINEDYEKTRTMVAVAILQCYRHLYYPSNASIGGGDARLGHTTIELQNASDSPGNGQTHIRRALREQKKLLAAGDSPDAPTYVRDQTPLKVNGEMSTMELRNEFRRSPGLSILLDDSPLKSCVQMGIKQDVFIYRKSDLVWGPGDPTPEIQISDSAFVHTMANAKEKGIWPRAVPEPEPPVVEPGTTGGGQPAPPSPPVPEPQPSTSLKAEGLLRQALVELFEKARKAKVDAFGSLTMRLFEYKPAMLLHQAVATYRECDVSCSFEASLCSEGIKEFKVSFLGSVDKANAIKSLIERPIQAAKDSNFTAGYVLDFKTPLATASASADEFIKVMTKYGGGEAFVEAQAAPGDKATGG